MFIVGLTGGIATGKSTGSRIFKDLGCPVIDADEIARKGKFKLGSVHYAWCCFQSFFLISCKIFLIWQIKTKSETKIIHVGSLRCNRGTDTWIKSHTGSHTGSLNQSRLRSNQITD